MQIPKAEAIELREAANVYVDTLSSLCDSSEKAFDASNEAPLSPRHSVVSCVSDST